MLCLFFEGIKQIDGNYGWALTSFFGFSKDKPKTFEALVKTGGFCLLFSASYVLPNVMYTM